MSDHDDHGHLDDAPHATRRDYLIGFWASVVLTIIPFWLVLGDVLDNKQLAIFYIIALGTVQMIVHMVYFLHMNASAEEGWIIMSAAFTVLLVVIAISGSIWIMWHLDQNMMPDMAATARALP